MAGESIDKAITVVAEDEITGVEIEYTHIAGERCVCGGRYEVQMQQFIQEGDRKFDRIDVRCESCGAERPFFFDITSFFGKL